MKGIGTPPKKDWLFFRGLKKKLIVVVVVVVVVYIFKASSKFLSGIRHVSRIGAWDSSCLLCNSTEL
jgi:capsule polysaccharide export protein KpsE/RkpR